jgi:predicted acylesterase/phospholipase RssA
MLYNGDVLVDGAVMNHFPLDVMRERIDSGTLIAVNTSPRTEKLLNYQFGPSISGWRVLWSKINPFTPTIRVPSIFHTLVRATEINSVYRLPTIQGLADILIEPAVESFRTLDFGAYAEIIEIGYRAAKEQLAGAEPFNPSSVTPVMPPTTVSTNTVAQSV